jgi:CheY-like chemotaxis protein
MKNTQPAILVENLRILVIDDNETHRKAAQAQLGKTNHVTVVGTYDEAQKLLAGTYVSGKGREGMETFDMVLTDLLMPASGRAQGDKGQQYIGEEMAIGIFLALLAAKQGAKHVAVFTDTDHHSHPASACFDIFNEYGVGRGFGETQPEFLKVEGAKVVLANNRNWVNHFHESDFATTVGYDQAEVRDHRGWFVEMKPGYHRAKSWDKLASWLLNGEAELDALKK